MNLRPHSHRAQMVRPLLLSLFLLGCRIAAATGAPPDTVYLTLQEAIVQALEVSPEVAAEQAGQEFAEARRRLARASRIAPQFTANTAHSVAPALDVPADNTFPDQALYLNPDVRNNFSRPRPFNRIEVELVQPLWTWGELGGSIRAARHGVDVEAAEVSSRRLEVAQRTGELYFSLLLTEALVRLAAEAGDVIERAKREIDRLLEGGAEGVDYADLYQVQITEQEYIRRVVEVHRRRTTARAALQRQLFLRDDQVAAAAQPVLSPIDFQRDSLPDYLSLALVHRPELRQAAAGVAARTALLDVARSSYYPKLFLGASMSQSWAAGRERQPSPYVSDPFMGRSLLAGLAFRQNLNFLQTRARVDQAEAERLEVVHQQNATRQLVQFEVEEAYNNLVIAKAALQAQDRALALSKEWLQTESINFDLDLGDTENLVDAVRANLDLEAAYFDAVFQYNRAILRLLRAAGVLDTQVLSGTLVD